MPRLGDRLAAEHLGLDRLVGRGDLPRALGERLGRERRWRAGSGARGRGWRRGGDRRRRGASADAAATSPPRRPGRGARAVRDAGRPRPRRACSGRSGRRRGSVPSTSARRRALRPGRRADRQRQRARCPSAVARFAASAAATRRRSALELVAGSPRPTTSSRAPASGWTSARLSCEARSGRRRPRAPRANSAGSSLAARRGPTQTRSASSSAARRSRRPRPPRAASLAGPDRRLTGRRVAGPRAFRRRPR